MNDSRLIEHAFPLKQASLTSVHEKNVRHGHISTLHVWPARRPLAASRATILAALLPDPSTPEERRALSDRIGGRVVESVERKRMPNGSTAERIKEEVAGGLLGWIGGEPKSGGKKKKEEHKRIVEEREAQLAGFREAIRDAFGGRAPKVLDPFAGGGAIPLEAMRLGCETTAADLNPVAWFILKGTLEYPQKFVGKSLPLPEFILRDEGFMEEFYRVHPHLVGRTKRTESQKKAAREDLFESLKKDSDRVPRADLAWQVRAWGTWLLREVQKALADYYPTYAEFEPADPKRAKPYEPEPLRLLPKNRHGLPDVEELNKEFSAEYLSDAGNPRWVARPTVAYLWARTVTCKNCRAELPLLKTMWLAKKDNKRVLLEMQPKGDRSGVDFAIKANVPAQGGNAAQKREHDKRIGAGTMSRSGATCPCCGAIMTMEDIRVEGKAKRIGMIPTAVVVEKKGGKEYRLPTAKETEAALKAGDAIEELYGEIPFGLPDEPMPSENALGMRIPKYGFSQWKEIFTSRQLLALGTVVRKIREFALDDDPSLSPEWREAITAYLTILFDKTADYSSTVCTWHNTGEKMRNTFARFAIPITWDVAEVAVPNEVGGALSAQLAWIARYIDIALRAVKAAPPVTVERRSATQPTDELYDAIVTDPPYYDAIPYSDAMDFFYVWIKRILSGTPLEGDWFGAPTAPKWDHEKSDGELIDDDSRHGGDATLSKQTYEDGMARAFQACEKSLRQDGRLIIVFAHKHPNAWETLVSAIIRAGFIVDGSWPIQTEMGNRMRGRNSAALSSSVWLVCRKREPLAKPGWDNRVLEEMRANITGRLREYWDAGIRGPDFVWAATGPALEAYSRHPVVKKANIPGERMGVSEFLSQVRRMVVDFVVGQVLTKEGEGADMAAADRMDAPTAYYLLHRHDFAMDEAPAGACILYATACGLSDRELEASWDLVSHKGSSAPTGEEPEDPDAEEYDESTDSAGKMRLKTWAQRKRRTLGYEAPGNRPVPLIDKIHRLMHLWREGDLRRVDEYLDENGLRRHELFNRLLQSMIELSTGGSEERSLLESISNHLRAKGATARRLQDDLGFAGNEASS